LPAGDRTRLATFGGGALDLQLWETTVLPRFRYRALVSLLLLSVFIISSQTLAEIQVEGSDKRDTADHVHVSARRSGDSILVTLRIDPGYHVNANPASNEYLIPTSVSFEGTLPDRLTYPPPTPFQPEFARDQTIGVYEGNVDVIAAFKPGSLNRIHQLGFKVTAQACTKKICLPPDDISGHASW
jgi:hypothetical protein